MHLLNPVSAEQLNIVSDRKWQNDHELLQRLLFKYEPDILIGTTVVYQPVSVGNQVGLLTIIPQHLKILTETFKTRVEWCSIWSTKHLQPVHNLGDGWRGLHRQMGITGDRVLMFRQVLLVSKLLNDGGWQHKGRLPLTSASTRHFYYSSGINCTALHFAVWHTQPWHIYQLLASHI